MKHKVTLEFDESADSLAAGLRMDWVNGEDSRVEINLTSGAGVCSPFMVFTVTDKKTKKSRSAVADIRPMVKALTKSFTKS